MNIEQIIYQLCSLREHCGSMIDKDEPDSVWMADVEALDFAIIESKRGAARAFCHKHRSCEACPLNVSRHEHHCSTVDWGADEKELDAILKAIREVSGA